MVNFFYEIIQLPNIFNFFYKRDINEGNMNQLNEPTISQFIYLIPILILSFFVPQVLPTSLCVFPRINRIHLFKFHFFRVTKTGDSSLSPKQLIICLSWVAIYSIRHHHNQLRIVLILYFHLRHLTTSDHFVCGTLSSVRIVLCLQSWSRSQTRVCYVT